MDKPFDYNMVDNYIDNLIEHSRQYSQDGNPAYAYVVGYLNTVLKHTIVANEKAKESLVQSIEFFNEQVAK